MSIINLVSLANPMISDIATYLLKERSLLVYRNFPSFPKIFFKQLSRNLVPYQIHPLHEIVGIYYQQPCMWSNICMSKFPINISSKFPFLLVCTKIIFFFFLLLLFFFLSYLTGNFPTCCFLLLNICSTTLR